MSGLPPKPDFDSRDDDRRSPSRRPERSDHDRRASGSRGPPPIADSYIAPGGDTYVPRHDERPRRPSPPPRSWRDPPRRSPPPRREDWRHRDEPIDRRRDYPSRPRDYPRGGPRDWRRDRDYDDRDRRYSRRSPSPYDRDRRWSSRGSPSPPRRSTYDYRRRSPPYQSRRSASPPPRYRRPSPGRREDGRFSPRRPPPQDEDRDGGPTHRRSHSRSRTRSRTPRPPAQKIEVQPTESTHEIPASAPIEGIEVSRKPSSPHSQKTLDQPSESSEIHIAKPSIPSDALPGPTVDADVTMVDVQPPTQPKAFAVSTAVPPTQPKNFNRPPPTGPRFIPTSGGQLRPPHQPPIQETSPVPAPTQPDPGTAIGNAQTEGEPEITLPEIERFELPTPSGRDKVFEKLDKTIDELLRKSYLMRTEYGETLKAARKAMHEQEMAEIELAAARMRREVADSQLEKARLGLLGVEYDGVSGLTINE